MTFAWCIVFDTGVRLALPGMEYMKTSEISRWSKWDSTFRSYRMVHQIEELAC